MEIIRISAIWCSSCIIMKQRLNKVIDNKDIKIIDYDYDLDYEMVEKYQIGDILPVIINGNRRLVGEHSIDEIKEFLRID